MTRNMWTAALAIGTVLAVSGMASAQQKAATITLGGKGTAAQAATQDNEEARWGGYGYGGYRYGGGWGGYGYGGYSGYSYHRPYSGYGYGYSNYRPYYGYNSYRPYYSSYGYGNGYGYGHGYGWRGISGEDAPTVNLGGTTNKMTVEPSLPSPFSTKAK